MLYIFLCLLPSLCHTHTYPPEVYDVLFGNLSLEELFLPEATDDTYTEDEMKKISNLDVREILRSSYVTENNQDVHEAIQNVTADSEDAKDYNAISAKLYNFTRKRQWSFYWGMTDWDDWFWNWDWTLEPKKRESFEKICLMYLYHARYKIELAFKQREPMRGDKRYKLGYLFNRLRRLKTEMLKFVAVAKQQHEFNKKVFQNLTSLMRLYERVVHFDVDIRDTTALITEVYSKEEPYDIIGEATNAKGDSKVRPKMAGGPGQPSGESGGELGNSEMEDLKSLLKPGG